MEFLDDSKISKVLNIIIIILLLIIMGLLVKDVFFSDECVCPSDNVVSFVEKDSNIEKTDEENVEAEDLPKVFTIDIKGAVKNPGVYRLNEGSIINDAIKLAGGLKSGASTKYINLSKKVSDEMVLTIYTNSEVNKMNNSGSQICEVNSEDIKKCEGNSVIVSGGENNTNNKQDGTNISKVSINKGSKEELMTLNGIGEAKAIAIIEYRNENNGFKTLEELMNVSGIGEQAYNKIKDNITL